MMVRSSRSQISIQCQVCVSPVPLPARFTDDRIRIEPQTAALKNIQIGLPKLPDGGSVTHFEVLRSWIRDCDRSHQCFPKQTTFVPTRLLDVGDHMNPETIRLLENGSGDTGQSRYVALSHRWGSPQQGAMFCAYRSNLAELRRGIDLSRLPRTFQDAVRVTRGLGLPYLWIDSVCIVQDDPDDWETESRLMERVFSSAYCTLAASCSSGSGDGMLKPRPERQCVALRADDGGGEENAAGTCYVCAAVDDFHAHVDRSELNQRGWVLQERALSRRTIYFTETQSYWECGGGVRCETMTRMKK
jgi:hypothetical protein